MQAVGLLADVLQRVETANVDEVPRPGESEVHHGDQGLASGDDLRVLAQLGEQS